MKAYFPSLFVQNKADAFAEKTWSAFFLEGLDSSEKQEHHTRGEGTKNFLIEARDWDNEREAFWDSQG